LSFDAPSCFPLRFMTAKTRKIKKGRKTPDTRTKRRNAVYNNVLSVRNGCPKGVRPGHLGRTAPCWRTAANNSSGRSYKCANLGVGAAFLCNPFGRRPLKSADPFLRLTELEFLPTVKPRHPPSARNRSHHWRLPAHSLRMKLSICSRFGLDSSKSTASFCMDWGVVY